MVYSEVEEYISSINALKKENPDMCILSGFEAEYYPEIEEFLGELRSKVDYMIMGEHFLKVWKLIIKIIHLFMLIWLLRVLKVEFLI